MTSDVRQKALAYSALVLSALFWAGNAVLARAVVGEIRPISLAFIRWSLALLVLLPFGLPHLRRGRATIRAQWLRLFWLGLLSVAGFNTLLYFAARTTTAINITLVNSTMPVVIAILARFMLAQRTTTAQIAGFVAAAVGMLTIVGRGEWQVLAELAFREGDLLMVVAVIVWGLYSVLLRLWRIDLHMTGLLTVTVIVGTALLLPAFLWEVNTFGFFDFRPVHVLLFLYLAVFASILAFLFWNNGVAVIGPSETGMFIYLVPVFTAALATVFLDETLHAYHGVGGALILGGLYFATRRTGSARKPARGEMEPEVTDPAA
jgi:drug/metabolite transporter (DMT)-like permease